MKGKNKFGHVIFYTTVCFFFFVIISFINIVYEGVLKRLQPDPLLKIILSIEHQNYFWYVKLWDEYMEYHLHFIVLNGQTK